jgi:uncharacterized membrane protein
MMSKQERVPRKKRIRRVKSYQEEISTLTDIEDIVEKDIQTIFNLHMHNERKMSHHQRFLEMLTSQLGRPRYFYLMVFFVAGWIAINAFGIHITWIGLDRGPFPWLQCILGLNAFFITVVVLSTQNRQGKLDEHWRHLDLEVNLLMEHKVSKVIALLEELRQDLPNVPNRPDPQAEAMAESIDPQTVFQALSETFEEPVTNDIFTLFPVINPPEEEPATDIDFSPLLPEEYGSGSFPLLPGL